MNAPPTYRMSFTDARRATELIEAVNRGENLDDRGRDDLVHICREVFAAIIAYRVSDESLPLDDRIEAAHIAVELISGACTADVITEATSIIAANS